MFNGKRIPMKVLDICQDQTDQIPITKSKSATKQHYRSKSTPSSFSELQISNNENQNNLPTKNSLLIPFRKAVQKISSQTKNANPRRKSCYGSLFGNIQQKQIDHLPTVIEMHRRINGKEFALSSFTQLLKKSQRNSPQCLTSKNKIIQEEFVVEHDTMERPPTCKTIQNYKTLKVSQKLSLHSSLKCSSYEWQQQKFSCFRNDSKSRKIKLSSIPFINSVKSRKQTIKLQSCLSELLIAKGAVNSTYRSMQQESPYQKQKEFLQKQIKFELKSRSIHNTKAMISVFCY
ncbi:unnamed protein product (macronuclear) [Paramecium tetraurelia]|uniref:Uncharacterized protein n=1 Tax=Paramecium tetraurelia TaxID=5888 RepID=A0BUZ1_PARTE|nr:uncharacterized protein GSPATT00005604001 [Paramecium tetraurelia]CAK62358.1 unnamed protein product [Paramecium tetraurelia]|eukprot:XP_001429756.1 hypothetical protein (macronuclear) [Paramecium tetraurelia strain d4-2]